MPSRPARETAAARQAFNDYYDLGPTRSLEKLLALYQTQAHTAAKAPPTLRIKSLKLWSATFAWQERIRERDARIEAEAEAEMIQLRKEAKQQRLLAAQALKVDAFAGIRRLAEQIHALQDIPLQDYVIAVGDPEPLKGGGTRQRYVRLPGLLSHLPTLVRALEVAHKEERLDLGDVTERVEAKSVDLDTLFAALPPDYAAELRDLLQASLEPGD